jgi:serine protease
MKLLALFFGFIFSTLLVAQDTVPGVLMIREKASSGARLSLRTSGPSLADLHSKFKPKTIREIRNQKKAATNSPSFRFTSEEKNVQVLEFDESANMSEIASAYSEVSAIEYAEPLYIITQFNTDSEYSTQQDYLRTSTLETFILLPENSPPLIALIDTGVDFNHPDLITNAYINPGETINGIDDDNNGYIDDISGFNFVGYYETETGTYQNQDTSGHGTHEAGLITGVPHSPTGIRGINTTAKILNVRIFDDNRRANQLDAAIAIRYAVDSGAKIINCSWGFFKYNTVLKEAIEYAIANECLVFAAVGNTNTNLKEYPSSFENVIGIGSVDINQSRSYFSTFGEQVDYVMYGNGIYGPNKSPDYQTLSGTSQATAIASGIAAKIWSYNPTLTASEVLDYIRNATVDLNEAGKDIRTGYGLIDGQHLLTLLNWTPPITTTETTTKTTSNSSKEENSFFKDLAKDNPILLAIGGFLGIVLISVAGI